MTLYTMLTIIISLLFAFICMANTSDYQIVLRSQFNSLSVSLTLSTCLQPGVSVFLDNNIVDFIWCSRVNCCQYNLTLMTYFVRRFVNTCMAVFFNSLKKILGLKCIMIRTFCASED